MTKIVFKTPCFQDKNYQQELGAILPAWRWARIACHGNIKTVTNVFIPSSGRNNGACILYNSVFQPIAKEDLSGRNICHGFEDGRFSKP